MKLIMENWRKYLKEEEEKDMDISQEDKFLFYEWLTSEIKDGLFKNWIEIHQKRARYVAPRYGDYYEASRESWLSPRKIEKPSDACTFDLYNTHGADHYAEQQSADGTWDRERSNKAYYESKELLEKFRNSHEEIKTHLDKIKLKFPYDIFPELDCREKMKRLDRLVIEAVWCPYPPDYSMTVSERLSAKNLKKIEGEPTPYEKCVIKFKNRKDAEDEVPDLPRDDR